MRVLDLFLLGDLKILFLLFGSVVRVAVCLLAVSAFSNIGTNGFAKFSAYECGFQPASAVSAPFVISYFLVALVFVVFDVEILFLFPFIEVLNSGSCFGVLTLVVFIFLLRALFLGWAWELRIGGLEFEVVYLKGSAAIIVSAEELRRCEARARKYTLHPNNYQLQLVLAEKVARGRINGESTSLDWWETKAMLDTVANHVIRVETASRGDDMTHWKTFSLRRERLRWEAHIRKLFERGDISLPRWSYFDELYAKDLFFFVERPDGTIGENYKKEIWRQTVMRPVLARYPHLARLEKTDYSAFADVRQSFVEAYINQDIIYDDEVSSEYGRPALAWDDIEYYSVRALFMVYGGVPWVSRWPIVVAFRIYAGLRFSVIVFSFWWSGESVYGFLAGLPIAVWSNCWFLFENLTWNRAGYFAVIVFVLGPLVLTAMFNYLVRFYGFGRRKCDRLLEYKSYLSTGERRTETALGTNVYNARYEGGSRGGRSAEPSFTVLSEPNAGVFSGKLGFKDGELLRFFPRLYYLLWFLLVGAFAVYTSGVFLVDRWLLKTGIWLVRLFYWLALRILVINGYRVRWPGPREKIFEHTAGWFDYRCLVFCLGLGLVWFLVRQRTFSFLTSEVWILWTRMCVRQGRYGVGATARRIQPAEEILRRYISPEMVLFERPSMGDAYKPVKRFKTRTIKGLTETFTHTLKRYESTERLYKKIRGRFVERVRRERFALKKTVYKFTDRYVDPSGEWRNWRFVRRTYGHKFSECRHRLWRKLQHRKPVQFKNSVWRSGSLKPKNFLFGGFKYRQFWLLKKSSG